ncbi:MAG: tRNA (adenosine(37)-N6)-threonylcarbamoyltransferase complex dimerization subunit type 1 TsaB [Gammaproteobacteria bacterium]|tara:strand:- start:2534 stop:3220 length:687 start_codon:yes stop_codon:yes gene_type:complete
MILFIDTAFNKTILAVKKNNEIFKKEIKSDKNISQTLIEETKEILEEAKLDKRDIKLLSFNNGPGNFTSLRISLTYIKSISFYLQIPVIPINSFQVLALALKKINTSSPIIIAIDARMNEIYWAFYQNFSEVFFQNKKYNLTSEIDMYEKIENLSLDNLVLIQNNENILKRINNNILFSEIKIIDSCKTHLKEIFSYIDEHFERGLVKKSDEINLLYIRDKIAKKKYE